MGNKKYKIVFGDIQPQTTTSTPQSTSPIKKFKVIFGDVKPTTKNDVAPSTLNKFNDKKEFVDTFMSLYKPILKQHGISEEYAYYLTAQAALESSWGEKPAGIHENVVTNNYIGEKDFSGKGHIMNTTEYVNGKPVKVKDSFKIFDSVLDMAKFHVWKFTRGRWVAHNIYDPSNIEGFGARVATAGYATDPKYGEKIKTTVEQVKNLSNG